MHGHGNPRLTVHEDSSIIAATMVSIFFMVYFQFKRPKAMVLPHQKATIV
jgi:hypothetical protein